MPAISPDILRQVKRIELRTRGLVNSRFVGEYHSVFKGQGMEFSEVREYQPGDEVRTIDWNVSARMRRLFVKQYVEERELTVLLIVDTSGSSRFGIGDRDKQSMAAELAAVLALTATRNNDRVGLILCSDHPEHIVPPRKGVVTRCGSCATCWPGRHLVGRPTSPPRSTTPCGCYRITRSCS